MVRPQFLEAAADVRDCITFHESHSPPPVASVAGIPDLMKEDEQLVADKPVVGSTAAPAMSRRFLTHLTVRKPDKIVVLRINEVEAIESAGNCVLVQAGKDSLLVRETLERLLGQLEPGKFMRVSRSAIVNLQQIRELLPNFLGDQVAILHSGKHLTVTRNLRDVEEALKFS
jgi:DNA-binding LytR/AlgR family response regulator